MSATEANFSTVLQAIRELVDGNGKWQGRSFQAAIMEATGLPSHRVSSVVRTLEQLGLIKSTKTPTGRSGNNPIQERRRLEDQVTLLRPNSEVKNINGFFQVVETN